MTTVSMLAKIRRMHFRDGVPVRDISRRRGFSRNTIPLGYSVTLCDPRPEYATESAIPGVNVVQTMPDDTVIEMKLDARSAVVALTHDSKLDDLALIEALEVRVFYIGAVGSRRNSDARRERLSMFGLNETAIANLRCPVGPYLGGSSPPEIALSIIADVTARRNGIAHYRVGGRSA